MTLLKKIEQQIQAFRVICTKEPNLLLVDKAIYYGMKHETGKYRNTFITPDEVKGLVLETVYGLKIKVLDVHYEFMMVTREVE